MILDYASKTMNDRLSAELRNRYPERELSQWEKEGAGYQKGLKEGHQQGLEKGHQQGRAEGLRAALLDILEVRGITLDRKSRRRIETCTDLAKLERWRERAKQVDSLAALFMRAVCGRPLKPSWTPVSRAVAP